MRQRGYVNHSLSFGGQITNNSFVCMYVFILRRLQAKSEINKVVVLTYGGQLSLNSSNCDPDDMIVCFGIDFMPMQRYTPLEA